MSKLEILLEVFCLLALLALGFGAFMFMVAHSGGAAHGISQVLLGV